MSRIQINNAARTRLMGDMENFLIKRAEAVLADAQYTTKEINVIVRNNKKIVVEAIAKSPKDLLNEVKYGTIRRNLNRS